MLNIENLTFGYKKKMPEVFEDFSLTLPETGICGLLGENGAGKSTLIYLMCGLLTPSEGQITINGVNVRHRLPDTLADIFLVPETYYLPAVELRDYARVNTPFYPRFSEEDMKNYLDIFGMTDDVKLNELSMGQQKKVLMSFALATHTPLLLLDEPTNGLDIPSKSQFRKFIAQGVAEDQTVLISTHQVRDVEQILDHIIIIQESKVLLNEPTQRICEKLSFVESSDKELAESALFCRPSFKSNELLIENVEEHQEDRIDLELLFNGVLNCPERIAKIFADKNETKEDNKHE